MDTFDAALAAQLRDLERVDVEGMMLDFDGLQPGGGTPQPGTVYAAAARCADAVLNSEDIPVTNMNKSEYVRLMAKFTLEGSRARSLSAVARGFRTVDLAEEVRRAERRALWLRAHAHACRLRTAALVQRPGLASAAVRPRDSHPRNGAEQH